MGFDIVDSDLLTRILVCIETASKSYVILPGPFRNIWIATRVPHRPRYRDKELTERNDYCVICLQWKVVSKVIVIDEFRKIYRRSRTIGMYDISRCKIRHR